MKTGSCVFRAGPDFYELVLKTGSCVSRAGPDFHELVGRMRGTVKMKRRLKRRRTLRITLISHKTNILVMGPMVID